MAETLSDTLRVALPPQVAFAWARLNGMTLGLRLGGEEFLVLLPQSSLPDAIRTASDLCALSHVSATGVEPPLGGADQALYDTKRADRNRVRVHRKVSANKADEAA